MPAELSSRPFPALICVVKFSEVIKSAIVLLQDSGRLTYRTLKREFDLDDSALEDLKYELIEGQRVAVDEDDKVLVWVGDGQTAATPQPVPSQSVPQAPSSYTPQHLAERIRAEQAAMESRGAADGERKTITALYADLKGSTALIEGLDPEDARAIIDPALQLMMDAVHRYDGYVAQALGDGIFALFGAPIAHEDHPQRALYAALRMQEEMRQHSDQSRLKGGIPLQMRVGINTGEVVVRSIRKDDLHTDYVPVGHSTNLAARMEQMANPGSIVISEYTQKLTEGYFDLKALGAADIKGVDEPLHVYEVLGAGPLRTRLQVSARRGLTRFVGRRSELDQMQQALEEAKAGHGQIVGVMGEPGLGKSRLFHEFKLSSQSGCLVLEAFGVSHGLSSPYLPIIELLKTYFQIDPTDDERARKEKVAGKVLILDRRLEDTLPYLFSLLGIQDPMSSLQQMDPQIRRQRTFEALKQLLLRESLNQPLILILEDLHWIDGETQGFLDTLSESIGSAPLLLLVNYRPEYRHEWGTKTYYTQLSLAPLGNVEAEELLTFLLGSDASLTALKQLILEKTEGTPFFIEEVVQTLAEEGVLSGGRGTYSLETTPTELHISPTVQGVLAARIDRLTGEEKALLQQLSVIGRQFPLSLVKKVVQQPETELYRVMSSLQAKEFLYEQPAFPEVEYLFKHALTQDVAYGTVLQERRKALHEKTGQALEALYTESLDEHATPLAHHYQLSGNAEKAVEYLHRASQQAVQRSANQEAIDHLNTALDLLQTLPDSPERALRELRLHMALSDPLFATTGFSSPELGRTMERAHALCQQVGHTPELFGVLMTLWIFHISGQSLMQTSRELAEQMQRLAQQQDDAALAPVAHFVMANTLFYLGELTETRSHLDQGMALDDAVVDGVIEQLPVADPRPMGLAYAALTLWLLGFPEQALPRSRESVTRAHAQASSFALTVGLELAALFHVLRREVQPTHERAEAALTLVTEMGVTLPLMWSPIHQGWALGEQGHIEEGIALLKKGLSGWREAGQLAWVPFYLGLLAELYGKARQIEAALSVLAEARELVTQRGECWSDAELYRLEGGLLLQQSPDAHQEAEACFLKAIEIAQKQSAKSWELRAATSLAKLWQQQGKTTEARDLLAPVYDWFTEGFDTADLKDAKALLDQL